MNRVEGKVAFVTGAARGQGRAHCVRLAQEGADIIAVDLCDQISTVGYPMSTEEDLAQTVAEVEALDRRIVSVKADVRDQQQLDAAVALGIQAFGRLDIVCANAGIASYAPAGELSNMMWDDMIGVALTGVWHTVKAALPAMTAGGRGGSIIITSSAAGLRAYPNLIHYASAKHGVVGLMRGLATDLGPLNIRVNTVHPGTVDTPMVRNQPTMRFFVPGTDEPTAAQFAEASQHMMLLPVPWVEAVDVANAVLFLASDEARFITGSTLSVDAGAALS